jgi:hypothetical protein
MPKKAGAALLKRVEKTLKAARRACDKGAATTRKARKQAAAAANKCYTAQSRVYKKALKGSQLLEVEKCFGADAAAEGKREGDFPSKTAFESEVKKQLESR